jgi:hypothetical protein
MGLRAVRFLSLLFTAVALGAALAHLLALPNKIHLSRDDYLVAQQIYRGWALLGIADIGALLTTFVLAVLGRRERGSLVWVVVALVCMAAALVVFFAFTYPANRQTSNWTVLPAHWEALRRQWEYSHAAGACLYLVAFASLILSILVKCENRLALSDDRRSV